MTEQEMVEFYFVDISMSLRKGTRELRASEFRIPVTDVKRAEQLMEHFAKGLREVFTEIEGESNGE